jgi:TolB protein
MLSHIPRRRILIAALAGAVFAALGITIASSDAATSADRNGRIVFTHRSFSRACCQETDDVMTIEPDGSDAQQLTNTAPGGGSGDPAWGPTRNWILFDSDRAGNVHVLAMNANGQGVRQVTYTDGFEFTPSASPDGQLLAFEHDAGDFSSGGIYVSRADGGGLGDFRQLTSSPAIASGGFDTSPNFSPDGRTIAFQRVLSDSLAAVFVVGVDGSGLEQLTPYALNAEYPRWSPDGTRLVFSSNTSFDEQQVWAVGADGGGLTQLTHGASGNPSFEPDWSPDGTKIVFAHFLPTGFFTQLEVMDADGSNVHVIWQGAEFSYDVRPDWGTRP